MSEFANSSNQAASLKENTSMASKIRAKKKAELNYVGYADGGEVSQLAPSPSRLMPEVSQSPDFIPDNQFKPDPEPQQQQIALGQASPDFISDDQFKSDEDTYGTVKQQVIAGAEGLAQGIAGPLAPMAERVLGVDPEAIRARAEANPWIHGGSEALGFTGSMMTGLGEGALIAHAGEVASTLVKGENLLSKMGQGASRAAAEMALMQGGDEITKMVVNDPNQSVQTAVTNIGLSGLIGIVGGSALGAGGALWKATVGDKVGQLAADFKGRITEHLENPDPLTNVTKELEQHYGDIKSMADEVYGVQGLKAQDIAKAMPEMSVKISQQASDMGSKVHEVIQKMMKKPNVYPQRLTEKLQSDLDQYISAIGAPNTRAKEIFNAAQDLKQSIQGYSKFDKFVKPVDEAYDFVKEAKSLGYGLRESLEDSSVWGKAADRQKAINKAFVQFKPALEDFEKKFTTEIAGERVMDPGKISTYMNQLSKPSAEIKQSMLRNFLDASEKYRGVINETHANLGIDSPLIPQSLNAVMNTLKEQSVGTKLADLFIKKGLSDVAGKGLGAAIGGAGGHMVGATGIGALLGEHTLGPFISSILPAVAKPLLKEQSSAIGLKSAVDYGMTLAKSNAAIGRAAKNVFRPGAEVLAQSTLPDERERQKLNTKLKELQVNPTQLAQGSPLGHYLKGHDTAAAQTAMAAVNYLNHIRPKSEEKMSPLDGNRVPSSMEKAMYNRALDIAQQPLIVLKAIKQGTVTPSDMTSLSTMYPALYSKLQQSLTDEMINHISKGENVPYATRIGLSLFLRQTLDSTMTPTSIAAAQPKATPQGPEQVGASKGSLSKLGSKSSKMAMTANQAAEADRQRE